MSSPYRVHAASVGKAATWASRATIDAALREAKFLISSGHDFVWIDDGRGNVIFLPAEVRSRLDTSSGKDGRRRESKAAIRGSGAMSVFECYLDMAALGGPSAREAADARFRLFLIDLAATRCDLAREFLEGVPRRLERRPETAGMAADLHSSDPGAAPSVEGQDELPIIPNINRRVLH
jgi:hypothetical protein